MKVIDKEIYSRKAHFDFFKKYDVPYFSVCANVDITKFLAFIKEHNKPFFVSFMYVASKIANDIPEFRLRIRNDDIIEHEVVDPAFTVMASNGVCSFMTSKYFEHFTRFVENTLAHIELEKDNVSIADEEDADDTLYISSMPWVSFTSVTHPMQLKKPDSIPRIIWGKYFKQGDKILLPLSVQVHHALMDGAHVGEYFADIQQVLDIPESLLLFEPDEDEKKAREYDTRVIRASSLNQRMRSKYPYKDM